METADVVLDIRQVPPPQRHPKIFRAWETLPVGARLTLINDHDPKPLFYEFKAERSGQFEWKALERGPERWSVEIRRVAAPPAVTGDMLVKDIAALSPAAKDALARRGLDHCCGGVHPLSMACQAHGADLADVLAELNAVIAPSAPAATPRPDWASKADHELDVREDLRAGKEPFGKIMAAVLKVGKGQTLLLRAIFEPKPLYKVLSLRGFSPWAEKLGEGDWAVWFRRAP